MTVVLTPGTATLDQLRAIWAEALPVKLDPASPGSESPNASETNVDGNNLLRVNFVFSCFRAS